MCSGPFMGAQGHNWLQTCTEGRDHIGWKRGEVVADDHCWILRSVLHGLFSTSKPAQVGPHKPLLKRPSKLLVWRRLGTGGLGAPGPDGPVLKVAHLGRLGAGGWGAGCSWARWAGAPPEGTATCSAW